MGIVRWIRGAAGGLLLGLVLVAPDSAYAQKRVALVIGNDRYANLPVERQLLKAVNDAEAIGDALAKLGFTVIRGQNLGRQGMIESLSAFTAQLAPGDTAAFFYAGHGVAIGGVNYLVPSDVPAVTPDAEARVRGNSIAEGDVVAEIQAKGVGVALLVIDACRDNPFPRSGTRSIGNTRGLADAKPARGVFTIYSAGIGQTALDRLEKNDPNRNSVFTRVFVQQLARTDLHLGDLVVEVREKVAELALKARNELGQIAPHEQTPAYYDQTIGGRVYLAGRQIGGEPRKDAAANPDSVAALQERLRSLEEQLRKKDEPKVAIVAPPAPATPPPSATPAVGVFPPAPGVTPPIDPASAPTVKWKLQNTFPAKTPTTLPLFARRLSELSGGRMTVELLPAGAVAPAFQLVDAVRTGTLDLGYGSGNYIYGKDKAFALMQAVPFGFTPRDHLAFRRRPDVAAIFDDLLAKQGVVALPCGSFGRSGEFWSKKPFVTPANLARAKLRFVALAMEIYTEAGAAVNALPGGEIVPAIDRDLLDGGQFTSPKNDLDLGFPDVAKYYYYPGSVTPAFTLDLFIARAKWAALPAAGRQILEQACREAVAAMINDYERLDREALAELTRQGVSVARLPPAIEKSLYAASAKVLTRLSSENNSVRALMAIVEKMRSSTLAAKLQ